MTTTDTTEIDIHLDTSEGLVEFVLFITDQYQEFRQAADIHKEVVGLLLPIKKGKDAYEELRDAIAVARGELTAGGAVSAASIAAMQQAYDEFGEAYLTVTEQQIEVPEVAEVSGATRGEEPEAAAITPRFAIRERFEQSLEDAVTAEAIYAPVANSTEETSLPYLAYQQLKEYKSQIRDHLSSLQRVSADNRDEIEYLHQTSLEIEKGVLRVAAALEEMFPDEVEPEELEKPVSSNSPSQNSHYKPFLTDQLREDEDIQAAVAAFFPSMQKFESALWQYVAKVEEPSKLDKVLQVKHGSIFRAILQGMTLAEVDALRALDGEQIRAALLELQQEDKVQYDYTIFVTWMDEYAELAEAIETYPDMMFEELIAIADLVRRELDAAA